LERIYNEQGPDKWVPVAWHSSSSGMWYTTEAGARRVYYGVTGYPTAYVDGTIMHRGAYTNNDQMYNWYMSSFNTRRAVTSPLTIEFLQKSYGNNTAAIKVKLTLEQSIPSGHVCHLVLWEDDMSYGGRTYRFVERRADTKNVTITNANETQEISTVFALDGGWKKADLGVSVFVQDPNGKEIKQGRATMLEVALNVTPTSLGRVKALYN
jgi:hypothetical protein